MDQSRLIWGNREVTEYYETPGDIPPRVRIMYKYSKWCDPQEYILVTFNGKDGIEGRAYQSDGGIKFELIRKFDPFGEKISEFKRRFRQFDSELSDKVVLSPEAKKLWEAIADFSSSK